MSQTYRPHRRQVLASGAALSLLASGAARAARPLTAESLGRVARAQTRLRATRVDVRALHAEVEEIFRENGFA